MDNKEWPKPITKRSLYNWITSDGIKWATLETAMRHQAYLEHDNWSARQLQFIEEITYTGEEPNKDMPMQDAFATVIALACMKMKDMYNDHHDSPTVHDENFLTALQKVTDLACCMYDTPLPE